jgi:hypothetical protein
MTRHFKILGFCVALLGLAILAAAGAYDMQTFRSSPRAPDATHTVMQESHGIQHFEAPERQNIFVRLNIVGVFIFAVGAVLLLFDKQLNKHDA